MNIKESLELYYKHLKYEKNLAVNSINAYQKDLAQLADFLSKKQIVDTDLINLDLFQGVFKISGQIQIFQQDHYKKIFLI